MAAAPAAGAAFRSRTPDQRERAVVGVGPGTLHGLHQPGRACPEMLAALSLRVANEWWIKPLTATGQAAAGMSRVTGTGFAGILGPAPPGSARSQRLDRRGWDAASQWYLGQPG